MSLERTWCIVQCGLALSEPVESVLVFQAAFLSPHRLAELIMCLDYPFRVFEHCGFACVVSRTHVISWDLDSPIGHHVAAVS